MLKILLNNKKLQVKRRTDRSTDSQRIIFFGSNRNKIVRRFYKPDYKNHLKDLKTINSIKRE